MTEIDVYETPLPKPFFNQAIALGLSILSLAFFISVYSCSKDATEPPPALMTLIDLVHTQNPDCTCAPTLNEYYWKNKTVYVVEYKASNCNSYPLLFNDTAEEMELPAGYSFNEFLLESRLVKTAWQCN